MSKYYFCKYVFYDDDIGDEFCYELKTIIKEAKELGLKKVEVIEAEADTGIGFFYCDMFNFCGEVGEGCGKECEAYKPRNGKNGRCVHSGHCYSRTDKKRTIKLK